MKFAGLVFAAGLPQGYYKDYCVTYFTFVKGFKFPTLAEKFHEWKHTV